MKKYVLVLITLCLGISHLNAQSDQKDSFTDKEVQLFSEVYQYQLDHSFDVVSSIKKNASKIKIEESRLSAILQAQFAGKEMKISKSEQIELNKLQELMLQDETEHSKKFNAILRSKNITPERFATLSEEFSSNNELRERVRKQALKTKK